MYLGYKKKEVIGQFTCSSLHLSMNVIVGCAWHVHYRKSRGVHLPKCTPLFFRMPDQLGNQSLLCASEMGLQFYCEQGAPGTRSGRPPTNLYSFFYLFLTGNSTSWTWLIWLLHPLLTGEAGPRRWKLDEFDSHEILKSDCWQERTLNINNWEEKKNCFDTLLNS